MYKLKKHHTIYKMSANNSPALQVPSGSAIVFDTCDCFEDQISEEDSDFSGIDWNHINPATGPLYVEGAQPGDLLLIHIDNIEVATTGVMTTGPRLGVFGEELERNYLKHISVDNGHLRFSENITLPVRPMVGVIGTAPADGESVPCGTPGKHGGNMDCRRITTGSTLVLPVSVSGALLAIGDLHATMGDGEVAVCGVEISGSVTVRVEVLKGKSWSVPMLFDSERIVTIASAQTLDEASAIAAGNMVEWLTSECQMAKEDAIFLLSAVADVRICQMVDPLRTARVELPRSSLASYSLPL
jgi:amidase